MAVHHITLTLSGSAQPLSTTSNPSINCREIHIQTEVGNEAVYVGGAGVSATDYGQVILTETNPQPLVIRDAGHNINLLSTYVIGTANQKIHILYVQ